MLNDNRPLVSIVIKTLNEEQHVASAIESALAALGEVGGEVILADTLSSDRTIDVAGRYPIKIVQLNEVRDRSCGAGAQLGFQHCSGRYVCLIDGDMELRRGFLPAAIRCLEDDAKLAGVGGLIVEAEGGDHAVSQRAIREEPDRRLGRVTRLDCGGLYRRAAIESVGYFTDRNLHGGEAGELGARLRALGWTLERIGVPAVDRCAHSGDAYRLLMQRIASRIVYGSGETVRAALGRPHLPLIFDKNGSVRLCLLVYAWWLSILSCLFLIKSWPLALLAMAALFALPIAVMVLRRRSFAAGFYSVMAWNADAIGFLPGLLRPRLPPDGWIDSTVVKDRTLVEALERLSIQRLTTPPQAAEFMARRAAS